jgi:hypothetical protein
LGLLDLPSVLLDWCDTMLAMLPPALRIVVWAALTAAGSMWLYAAISPQRTIVAARAEMIAARHALAEYDGPFEDAWSLIARALGTAMRSLWLVLPAAMLSSLPALVMLVWLSNAYGYRFPDPPDPIGARVDRPGFDARLVADSNAGASAAQRLEVLDGQGAVRVTVPLARPTPVVEKRQWWNALIGNPGGYLPPASPVERVQLDLPQADILTVGPVWLRSWMPLFFTVLVICSLLIKRISKIA